MTRTCPQCHGTGKVFAPTRKKCVGCGQQFIALLERSRYCSLRCGNRERKRRERAS